MNYELDVSYYNHTFRRISYANRPIAGKNPGFVQPGEDASISREYFFAQLPTDQLDFEDITTKTVTVELAGGLCNTTLGPAEVWFTRQPECGVNFRLIYNMTAFSNVFSIPAHRFDYNFGVMKTNLPTFNLAVRDYLISADNSTGEFNLVNVSDTTLNTWTRFEYHPRPTLTLSFSNMDQSKCDNNQTRPFFMISSLSRTNATIKLSEDYPADLVPLVPSCTNIQGKINITNNLGEDNPDVPLLSVCRATCPLDVQTETRVVTSFATICAVNVPVDSTAKFSCPPNGVVDSVVFASYGARANGACNRTFTNAGCRAIRAVPVTSRACLGKNNCSIAISHAKFGGNPCPNATATFFTAQMRCRIETTVYENAYVQQLMQVGYPNRFRPFFKTFITRMNVLGYIDDLLTVCYFHHHSFS
jgi:hypothetical protein